MDGNRRLRVCPCTTGPAWHAELGPRTWDVGEVASIAGWGMEAVSFIYPNFDGYWDGKKVIDAKDKTLPTAGKVGLWTKADSVTDFDDLTVAGLTP